MESEDVLGRRLYVADDLTGALEVGAILAGVDGECLVAMGELVAGARVVDCGARRLEGEAALERYRAVLRGYAGDEVFLKIDSTLRGPVREAAEVAREMWPECAIVVCPAYPAMGRTVAGGRVLVDGRPLREQAGAEKVGDGDVRAAAGVGAICPDAVTEEDLLRIAEEYSGAVLLASAGMLAAAADVVGRLEGFAVGKRWMVACGSMNAVSREQAERVQEIAGCVAFGKADALAARARELLELGEVDGVMVLGGDTGATILRDWGVESVRVLGEAAPGVPAAMARFGGREVPLMTKAGGFGGPDLLVQILGGGQTTR